VLLFRDLDSHSEASLSCSDAYDITDQSDVTVQDYDDISVVEPQWQRLVFESSGFRVEVTFVTDHVIQGSGWEVRYVGVLSCYNQTVNASMTSSGDVTSHNFPQHYPNMQQCFYTIHVNQDSERQQQQQDASVVSDVTTADYVIEVTFQDLHTESDSDLDAKLRGARCVRDFVEIQASDASGHVVDIRRVCGDWNGYLHLLYFRFQASTLVFR
jgi:hypothetical protein